MFIWEKKLKIKTIFLNFDYSFIKLDGYVTIINAIKVERESKYSNIDNNFIIYNIKFKNLTDNNINIDKIFLFDNNEAKYLYDNIYNNIHHNIDSNQEKTIQIIIGESCHLNWPLEIIFEDTNSNTYTTRAFKLKEFPKD